MKANDVFKLTGINLQVFFLKLLKSKFWQVIVSIWQGEGTTNYTVNGVPPTNLLVQSFYEKLSNQFLLQLFTCRSKKLKKTIFLDKSKKSKKNQKKKSKAIHIQ